jgi:hypothetical protein
VKSFHGLGFVREHEKVPGSLHEMRFGSGGHLRKCPDFTKGSSFPAMKK